MKSNRYCLCCLCLCLSIQFYTYAQEETDSTAKSLEEIFVSFNKWEQDSKEIPNMIEKVNLRDARLRNPQTTADLLGQIGSVFIQKSQLGGGSPMIRGFATNRVLMVVDGVRMNNAIYRSGNIQNIISIDPLSLGGAEVVFGPGSLIYGSDAIGGVIDFHTIEPKFSNHNKLAIKGSSTIRYASANEENTFHADIIVANRNWSFFSSFTYSKFGDLKMGVHGPASYLRKEYVERINNVDSIIANKNSRIQRFSGYNQVNLLHKVRYKLNDNINLTYSFTYAGTGEAPRYDRLIQYRNNKLRFAEWSYGPMLWRMHSLTLSDNKKRLLADGSRLVIGYQSYAESRIDRTRATTTRNIQSESVDAYSLNWDAQKKLGKGSLFYGLEYVYNLVGSVGSRTNISTGVVSPFVSRYPNNSRWQTSGLYGSYKVNVHEKVTLLTGLRYSYNQLNANFDTTFIKFPYQKTSIKDGGLTGNLGIVYRPNEYLQINGNVSTGYRMPNVDDVGKLFESVPGNLTVPNPNLQSEYAWNAEMGTVVRIHDKLKIELNVFHTWLNNAITLRPYQYNGKDSINFGGVLSRVQAMQNVSTATVWGLQTSIHYKICKDLTIQSFANWINGKETDDIKNEQVPLRHAAPFYGNTNVRYSRNKIFIEFSSAYNGEVKAAELAPVEQAKTDIYAKDANGKFYSPAWYTLNLKSSYQLDPKTAITIGWENITNQRYRSYSSGIVASGSNLILSVRRIL
ncbi:MAG: TonB-dependent receptor [Chitinophagaceae bacterium]|nr:TonB-dependent receptor [Chitinophagaceae bacterium]